MSASPLTCPWGQHRVNLHMRVRRFRCSISSCRRRIFTERLPTLVAPSARRTVRVRSLLQQVAVVLGGEAGARLSTQLGLPTSPSTLLRTLYQAHVPSSPPAPVIGVDDFALRRGQRYGTVIIDFAQRRPLDLLPGRTADGLATWLRGRAVTTITRDRSTEYARGIAVGAPQATEVLDRWHVHKNVRELVERVLDRYRQELGPIPLPSRTPLPSAFPDAPPQRSPGERVFRDARRAQRKARYEAVRALHADGVSWREIGRRLGLSRWTVRCFALAEVFPERRSAPHQAGILDPYLPYLRVRWAEGCHSALQLWREVRTRGYPGAPKRVRQWAEQQRQALPPTPPQPASTRQLSWLVVRKVDDLSPDEQAARTLLSERSTTVAAALVLIQALLAILRQRRAEACRGLARRGDNL